MKVSSFVAAALIGVAVLTPSAQAQAVSVSPELKAQLVYLVQEEKLARDVYTTLYAATGVRQFSNISSSERTHMTLMQGILKTYGIADPTVGLPVGSFKDASLSALYKKLIASGKTSTTAALAAGVAIEKKDITDINVMLKDNPPADVTSVLQRLLSGSKSHLAAFAR
ncbi:MAG: DUF2202 domain-containing protein [Candidatus Nanopelagicales bacterium]|nr:DUF2202 domain-containing protein [Candidatus Nanopelagicales bacterium]